MSEPTISIVKNAEQLNDEMLSSMRPPTWRWYGLAFLLGVVVAWGLYAFTLHGNDGPERNRSGPPGHVGDIHRQLRVLGRTLSFRDHGLCNPASLPGQLAQTDPAGRRGDDRFHHHRGRSLPGHSPGPQLGRLLLSSLPQSAGAVVQFPFAPLVGHDGDNGLHHRKQPFPLPGHDPRPGNCA